MLEALACLNGWKRHELSYTEPKSAKRAKTAQRFAVMSASLEIISGEVGEAEEELQEDFSEDIAMELTAEET